MRSVVATIALLVIVATPAWALQATTADRAAQAQQRFEQVKERLQLTPEQVEQVRPILMDEVQQLEALRDASGGTGQSRRERLKLARSAKDIQQKTDDQLKKILSKSQMDELKKIRDERRQERREHSGRN